MNVNEKYSTQISNRGKRCLIALLWVALMSVPALAQSQRLDDSWTVTANGQKIQVEPGGGFKLRNIASPDQFGSGGPGTRPDFLGDDFVRVVGTRTVDGQTQWAFSEPFQIRRGQVEVLNNITITNTPPPFPVRIDITTASSVIVVDGSAPLTVTAELGDGQLADVSMRSSWTIYRSSNTAIADVDANGVVSGVSVGTAVITAVNEGSTAVKRITVATSTQSTRLEGRVRFEDGSPAIGADVSVLNGATTSLDPDGAFEIADLVLPADTASLAVRASLAVDGTFYVGTVSGVVPVAGGITDAGLITLSEVVAVFETEYGTNLMQSDDDTDLVNSGFSFPFYGVDYTSFWVGSNGFITFGSGDTDYTESVSDHLTPQPRISAYFDDLYPGVLGADRQTYVNQLSNPNRMVITWNMVPEYTRTGSNTFQVVIFETGRIQMGYQGMTAFDAVVGLSPGNNPGSVTADFSEIASGMSLDGPLGVYQQFTSISPFDLDNNFLVYEPNGSGGYDISLVPAFVTAMFGKVEGQIIQDDGGPCANAVVEVTVSCDASFRAVGHTDEEGRFQMNRIPFGSGVQVRVAGRNDMVGSMVVAPNAGSAEINVQPLVVREKVRSHIDPLQQEIER